MKQSIYKSFSSLHTFWIIYLIVSALIYVGTTIWSRKPFAVDDLFFYLGVVLNILLYVLCRKGSHRNEKFMWTLYYLSFGLIVAAGILNRFVS